MPSESAFSDDWKLDTYQRIKADHDRRGIPYFTSGEERDKRAFEAHGGVRTILPNGIVIGISDAVKKDVKLDG